MELNELVQNIHKIDLLCKSISQQKLSGLFNSSFRGSGFALDTIRKYDTGDEIRCINWNVTARLREPYINTYHEEKERLVWLLVDVSKSGDFGTSKKSKLDLIIEIGATLAFSAIENKDRVGVLFFSDRIEKLIEPARGMANFWHIAKEMVSIKPEGNSTDLAKVLQFLMNISRQKSLVFLLSDFISPDYKSVARMLTHQHEVMAIRVFDEKEKSIPAIGWARIKESETGREKWVNTGSTNFKRAYQQQHQEIEQCFLYSFGYGSATKLSLSTSDNYMEKLIRFMSSRL